MVAALWNDVVVEYGPAGTALVRIFAEGDPSGNTALDPRLVPAGHVALGMRGQGGRAYWGGQEVPAEVVHAVLVRLGLAERPRLLLVPEALAGEDPIGERLARLAVGVSNIATDLRVRIDLRNWTVLAAHAAVGSDRRLQVAALGRFRVVVRQPDGRLTYIELYPTIPPGNDVELDGDWWEPGGPRAGNATSPGSSGSI